LPVIHAALQEDSTGRMRILGESDSLRSVTGYVMARNFHCQILTAFELR
jgi:hypothetical protein